MIKNNTVLISGVEYNIDNLEIHGSVAVIKNEKDLIIVDTVNETLLTSTTNTDVTNCGFVGEVPYSYSKDDSVEEIKLYVRNTFPAKTYMLRYPVKRMASSGGILGITYDTTPKTFARITVAEDYSVLEEDINRTKYEKIFNNSRIVRAFLKNNKIKL